MNEVIEKKPKLNLRWMDAPIESDKWINVCFDKSGSSYKTGIIWPSESVAKEKSDEFDKKCHKRFIETGDFWINGHTCGRKFRYSQYSHTFQIPVKE